ncbi:MAG TPA: hypothetical protein VNT27_05645 [Propionibacteriaceae bacterium]|nr:hypothetical protein [Propionibacteriaceae bacterium]
MQHRRGNAVLHRRHTELLILRDDVDVSIAWGMDLDPSSDATGRQPLAPGWAEKNGWSVSYSFVDVRYRGEVVDREILVSVDNGLAFLPADSLELVPREPGESDPPHIVRVSRFHYELSRLVHSVTCGSLHGWRRDYFDKTEIAVDEAG